MFQNAPGLGALKEDRLRSLEEITESEHRFRKLVEALPDAIVVHTEGRIVFVNPFAIRLHKAVAAEHFGRMFASSANGFGLAAARNMFEPVV
jgi:PAS domain-containing protein